MMDDKTLDEKYIDGFVYPSKKGGLFVTTIFTQFSSNAHPVLI